MFFNFFNLFIHSYLFRFLFCILFNFNGFIFIFLFYFISFGFILFYFVFCFVMLSSFLLFCLKVWNGLKIVPVCVSQLVIVTNKVLGIVREMKFALLDAFVLMLVFRWCLRKMCVSIFRRCLSEFSTFCSSEPQMLLWKNTDGLGIWMRGRTGSVEPEEMSWPIFENAGVG